MPEVGNHRGPPVNEARYRRTLFAVVSVLNDEACAMLQWSHVHLGGTTSR